MFRGGTKCLNNAALTVDGDVVLARDRLDFLGWSVDRRLNPTPFNNKQLSALRSRIYLMQRLSAKVPPAVLGPVARAIYNGKAAYSIEHSHPVRLTDTDTLPEITAKFQIAHNDMCRVIMRKRRIDHIRKEDLSSRAGIPSVNHTVFKRVAMLAWDAMNDKEHPAAAHFRNRCLDRPTRASDAHKLRPLLASSKALAMRSAIRVWNHFPEIRTAHTRAAAENVVKKLTKKIPF